VGLLVHKTRNDCESRLDTDVRCNAHDLILCTAKDLAANTHIDLNSDDVVFLDGPDTDDDKCGDLLVLTIESSLTAGLPVTDVNFTECTINVELEKPTLFILSLQMIMEKHVTDPDLIHLHGRFLCTHGNEAEGTVFISKYMQVQGVDITILIKTHWGSGYHRN